MDKSRFDELKDKIIDEINFTHNTVYVSTYTREKYIAVTSYYAGVLLGECGIEPGYGRQELINAISECNEGEVYNLLMALRDEVFPSLYTTISSRLNTYETEAGIIPGREDRWEELEWVIEQMNQFGVE